MRTSAYIPGRHQDHPSTIWRKSSLGVGMDRNVPEDKNTHVGGVKPGCGFDPLQARVGGARATSISYIYM